MSNQTILTQTGQMQDALRKNIEISKRKLYSELSRVLATNNKTNPKYYGL